MTHARPGHSLIGMTTHRIRGRAGVEANARLTAMTGMVLLALFIAEIATVLMGARSVLTLHVERSGLQPAYVDRQPPTRRRCCARARPPCRDLPPTSTRTSDMSDHMTCS